MKRSNTGTIMRWTALKYWITIPAKRRINSGMSFPEINQAGITTKNIAETNAELTTLHALSSRNTEMLKDTTKRTSEILETYENILSETDFFSGDAAAAEAMV